jgi:glycosyltransferase involved in cell wall biosynthesis
MVRFSLAGEEAQVILVMVSPDALPRDSVNRAMPPRVMHVIEPSAVGGAESVVRAYGIAGGAHGAPVCVAAIVQGTDEGPFVQTLQDDGTPVVAIRCGRRRYGCEVDRLVAELKQRNVQLVHTHVYHADFVGYWAARRCGVPAVATVHGETRGGWKNRLYEWSDRRLLRRFAAVLCVSRAMRERLRGAGCAERILHWLPNAHVPRPAVPRAAARRALGLPPDGPVVAWIGRLSREKGPDVFVDAMGTMPGPRPLAIMIGDGPERGRIARRIARSRLSDCVRLAGERRDVATLLAGFDALVISSRTEGLPMVLLEAAEAGVPIVAFAVGGVPEVLDESSAWLVPPGDVPGLGRGIRAVLESPGDAERRGARARAIARERFGPESWIEETYRIYAEVLRA